MTVYGYIRVSTQDQEANGHSIDAQGAAIAEYCRGKGLTVDQLLTDAGVSAGKPLYERPEGSRLKDLQRCDHVIATKLDRLFRSVLDCAITVDAWQRAGVTMHLLDLQVDTSSLSGKLVLQVLSAVAEMERGLTKERNRSVSNHLKRSGRVYGTIPYGMARDGDKLVLDPAEQRTLKRIKTMKAAGSSLGAIATYLNEGRIATRSGGIWYRSTLKSVLG